MRGPSWDSECSMAFQLGFST
uniref:Uncharacterized protein n=1 Tax=Arundo donax TaxID=35708 RepID=A0A0A9HB89_ARUDO